MYTKNICSKVLAVKPDESWSVIDTVGDLSMCHFKYSSEEENMPKQIRGAIVDVVNECLVAPSFGYHEILVSDEISSDENGLVVGSSSFEKAKLYPGTDGIIVRAFLHAGKVHLSSFKNIDLKASQAKLYDTDSFWNLYHQSGGPKLKMLFQSEKKYSAWVYHLLVSHEDVLTVTKQPLGSSRKVYLLHAQEVLFKENCPYPVDEVDWNRSTYPFKQLPEMSLAEANQFLQKGYYPQHDYENTPYQAIPGEYVAIYQETGETPRITLVHSRSYNNRYLIKRSRTNLRLRFFQLTNHARNNFKNEDAKARYLKLFPALQHPPLDGMFVSLKASDQPLGTLLDRIVNVWVNFVLALPLCKQAQAMKLLVDYFETQKRVGTKIRELYQKKSLGRSYHHKRIAIILENLYSELGHRKISQEKLEAKCQGIIRRETGSSLYLMDQELSGSVETRPKKVVGSVKK